MDEDEVVRRQVKCSIDLHASPREGDIVDLGRKRTVSDK
jgi:hypothetical protein